MSVLRVEKVSKSFRTYGSEWKRVLSWFGAGGDQKAHTREILRDIEFSVAAGESVGIIGQNGAGKSTLLKILAGTMQATSGTVIRDGRISALLELGMGFNPDMTGRANVMATAGLMGFSREKILGAMDSIEEFAEIGVYFDEPLRVYSSGMQVRLAFAVATAFRPEVLIVDEALAVGDTYFQHKSFARIREFREAGTTLLLVSHDRAAIISLCDRAILIHKGEVRMDGEPEQVLDLYNALVAEKEGSRLVQESGEDGGVSTISGTGEAEIAAITLSDSTGTENDIIKICENVTLKIDIRITSDIPDLVVGYMVKDRLGQTIFGTNTFYHDATMRDLKAGETLSCVYRFGADLGVGHYSVSVALHEGATHLARNYEWRDRALTFTVVNPGQPEFVGTSFLPVTVEIER